MVRSGVFAKPKMVRLSPVETITRLCVGTLKQERTSCAVRSPLIREILKEPHPNLPSPRLNRVVPSASSTNVWLLHAMMDASELRTKVKK